MQWDDLIEAYHVVGDVAEADVWGREVSAQLKMQRKKIISL